ncbi:MAG: DEAD/DEAH box helicase [Actinobacteria bacterium]|nr:DEAD/DEAH box helicase [Actinomycetota bacterium]
MAVNPLEVTDRIKDYYLRYLRTIFPIQDEELALKFREALEAERLVKGPYLEATPGYRPGKSVAELVDEGVLHPGFKGLHDEECFPIHRPLYLHQEKAVRKVVAGGRNLVIATGTGSGKTEAFLIPILDHLFREREAGSLGPGVRALLLYPMNALANDQIKRLRQVLSRAPDFTFGRYIGQTPHTSKEAEGNFQEMFPGEKRIPNELISREEMLESPPHILLTNYAMLEYLLIRPREHVFFSDVWGRTWKFLVLDEAHVYSGAKGTEMGYLIRRLKERVADGERGRLRCIATSATLGGGTEDISAIADFASQLFDEHFSHDAEYEGEPDMVEAALEEHDALRHGGGAERWEPDPGFYFQLREMVESTRPSLVPLLGRADIPPAVRAEMEKAFPALGMDGSGGLDVRHVDGLLYVLLCRDARLGRLREALLERPLDVKEAASLAFPGEEDALPALAALVELACRAKGERRLLPARYHLFVRAVEGAYVSFSSPGHVFLRRHRTYEENGESWRAFELAVCENCGSHFLVGKVKRIGGSLSLEEAPVYDLGDDEEEKASFFYPLPEGYDMEIDEDEVLEGDLPSRRDERLLCLKCGALSPGGASAIPGCSCADSSSRMLRGILLEKDSKVRDFCPRCSAPVTSLRRFVSRQDPTCAVLGTAFYQSTAVEHENRVAGHEPAMEAEPTASQDKDWSVDFVSDSEYYGKPALEPHFMPSRLLAFSDNRQDAAFFACFFEESYLRFLRRRLITMTVQRFAEEMMEDPWTLERFAKQVYLVADEHRLFPADLSRWDKREEAYKWVMAELLRVERRNNLEELGILAFDYDFRNWMPSPPALMRGLNLGEEQALNLICVLLDSMREQGAVRFPDGVDPRDEYFRPKNRRCSFRLRDANNKRNIFAWVPSPGWSNKRLDFLMRVMEESCGRAEEVLCRNILENIWKNIIIREDGPFMKRGYVSRDLENGEGLVFRLSPRIFRVTPGGIDGRQRWFRCNKCQKITTHNVLGLCPSTFRCTGRLEPCDPHRELAENHYYRLYHELRPLPMKVEEHTAQLKARRAGELQQQFMRGNIQVLSCSTTFELGVDVGELEAAFLRNVPPKPSNYVQRAGRAGRRASSVAYILTYAPLRSHDLYYFREPLEMIAGKIKPPVFYLENEKIARRHLHSFVIASFFRQNPGYYGKGQVKDFFGMDGEGVGLDALRSYLEERGGELEERLRLIFRDHMSVQLGLEDGSWAEYLVGEDGALATLALEIRRDIENLTRLYEERTKKQVPADSILRLIKTLRDENLIDRLAKGGVIPKYGFPVDVVELRLLSESDVAKHVELQRDLRIAIAEYAPGSRIVAGGWEIGSYAIKRVPDKEWEAFHYAICDECGMLHRRRKEESEENPFDKCESCGKEFRPGRGSRWKGSYLIPRFGFLGSVEEEFRRPGLKRPPRRHTTHVFFLPDDLLGESHIILELESGKARLRATYVPRSRLAVLNNTAYKVCGVCGYAVPEGEKIKDKHTTAYGYECAGTLLRYKLGHEFLTDVAYIEVDTGPRPREAWLSFLYALLEGASRGLGVERSDLDGCLYPRTSVHGRPAVILFDNVPGGAGHCRQLATKEDLLLRSLQEGKRMVEACECSPESSCYGCLRDYSNQLYHVQLSRRLALEIFDLLGL